jgi:hypothetical protein
MLVSSYFPHALYSAAIISFSIHLVNQQRSSSDDRARLNAKISVLQSISQQLQSSNPLSNHELERLRRLVRPVQSPSEYQLKEHIGWKEVIFGRKPIDSSGISAWDQKDVEKGVLLDISLCDLSKFILQCRKFFRHLKLLSAIFNMGFVTSRSIGL